jgi:hypothetical protein
MDEVPILSRDDGSHEFKEFASHYDAPAYVRRAREVQGAWEQLLAHGRRQRDEWLQMARIRLGTLQALAGSWEHLLPFLIHPGQIDVLRRLEAELSPRLRAPIEQTHSPRALRNALLELQESLERFNDRWRGFVAAVDLTDVNALREGYNRYYLIEKECVVRSPRIARQGFRPLEPLTTDDLLTALPLLPIPQARP